MKQSKTMIKNTITTIQSKAADFPDFLRNIPDPPRQIYVQSNNWPALAQKPAIAIVGSRKATPYGTSVTRQLASELARAGVTVVSGLALGIDGVAHQAALEAGGLTIAVLAGGLDKLHPRTHEQLARRIVTQGGALISEYPSGTPNHKSNFVERNRLVSGLSSAVLITKAAEKSGTLHTAAFALEQGREVLAVPGNITNPQSAGTNRLIKAGATPVTCVGDVFRTLGIQSPANQRTPTKGDTPEEQAILDLLHAGESDGGALLEKSALGVVRFNQTITMLELAGKIRPLGTNQWSLSEYSV